MRKSVIPNLKWHLSTISLALTIALISCNTTPKTMDSSTNRKPWKSSNTNAAALNTGYLSDQDWISATSTWGPVSKNLAYGEGNPADRKKITLSGTSYDKGLGTHADSSVTFKLDPSCSRFKASIGLDDQVRWQTEHGNVLFQVYGDNNTKLFDSQTVDGSTPTQDVDVDVSGQSSLKLVVDQNKSSTEGDQSDWYDQADWANARVECAGTSTPPPSSPPPPTPSTGALNTGFVSDQMNVSFNPQNGWGPIEVNMANGDDVNDTSGQYYNGHEPPLTLKTGVATKGLGVHAASSVEFPLAGQCSSFSALVGLDQAYLDKAGHTVNFQVFVDRNVKRESGVMNKDSAPVKLEVDLAGAQTLKLVVTDGGDGNAYDHADWADARVTCGTVSNPAPPTPTPSPTPPSPTPAPPTPHPQSGKTIWYLPAPSGSTSTSLLTTANIAWVNASPFDGVALTMPGISWEILRPNYTLNYNTCLTEAHKADGITKKKAILILTTYPALPTDTAAWAHTNAQFGELARCLKDAGWTGLFHDNEAYQDQNGNPVQWTDRAGWVDRCMEPDCLTAWAARYGEQAKIISDNFPGMTYGWYHAVTDADGVSREPFTGAGNENLSFGAAYSGMVNAIAAGAANLSLHDMGELYLLSGSAAYQTAANLRRNEVVSHMPTLTAAGRAAWSRILQIGFMRMPGLTYNGATTETSVSDVTQELKDLWPHMSDNGIAGFYNEASFAELPAYITEGVKAFNDGGRR